MPIVELMKRIPNSKGQRQRADETDTWPFIRWIESRQRWQVDARTKNGGQRRFFETKDEAEGWASPSASSERIKATSF